MTDVPRSFWARQRRQALATPRWLLVLLLLVCGVNLVNGLLRADSWVGVALMVPAALLLVVVVSTLVAQRRSRTQS